MSERLTERNAKGTAKGRMGATCLADIWQNETDILERLCDLEDKIEQWKILELPCAVGQTVYCIRYDNARKPFVKPLGVCSVTVWGKGGLTVFTTKEDSWGVTAFSTLEEAEAKLREMERAGE
jgi:hypothetical protein